MYELDRIFWDFCEDMGFHFDFSAPSHVEALKRVKERLREYQEKQGRRPAETTFEDIRKNGMDTPF